MARRGQRLVRMSANRRMAAASAAVCRKRNTIHIVTEADITYVRELLARHREVTGERLSLTAHVVHSVGRAVGEHPEMNALRVGSRVAYLEDVTVATLVEREIDGERVPEPFGLHRPEQMSFREVNDLIRGAQAAADERLGGLSGAAWVRFVPSFLFEAMIAVMSRNVDVAQRYGVVSVTAVGMFAPAPAWIVPLSASTVAVGVGSIVVRPALVDGELVNREHLCLTFSFDHDLVDGAPAARFANRVCELITEGAGVAQAVEADGA